MLLFQIIVDIQMYNYKTSFINLLLLFTFYSFYVDHLHVLDKTGCKVQTYLLHTKTRYNKKVKI